MSCIFLSCLYDDQNPETYEGIELRMDIDAEREVFNTGTPFHDYLTAACVAYTRAGEHAYITGSSSLDHFVFDGGVLPDGTAATEKQTKAAIETARQYLLARGEGP